MPLPTVYNQGVASVAAGGTVVTGATGADFEAGSLREGDLFWCAGLTCRILSVDSATQLTLAHPWPGAAQTGVAYEIHYAHDASRVLAKSTEILGRISTTALAMLGELTPAGDRMVYYTGPASADLTPLTSKGREIIAAADATAARTELGITFQANDTDATVGRVLRVGAFGLGDTALNDMTNLNATATVTGFWGVAAATTGTKPAAVSSKDAVLHIRLTGNICQQVYFSMASGNPIYVRRSTAANTWDAWRLVQTT